MVWLEAHLLATAGLGKGSPVTQLGNDVEKLDFLDKEVDKPMQMIGGRTFEESFQVQSMSKGSGFADLKLQNAGRRVITGLVITCVTAVGLVLSMPSLGNPVRAQEASPGGIAPVDDITPVDLVVGDGLIAERELLLNTYRCSYNIDTHMVPGGCADLPPQSPITEPRSYSSNEDRSVCEQAALPSDLSGMVELLWIDSECLKVTYEPLNGRTLEQVREQYRDSPGFLSASLPLVIVPGSMPATTVGIAAAGTPPETPWHLEAMDAKELWEGWPDGQRVVVAVLDTGVDASHTKFSGRVVESPHHYDFNGHGTHVAGIVAASSDGNGVAGIAPKSYIHPKEIYFPNDMPGLSNATPSHPTTTLVLAVVELVNSLDPDDSDIDSDLRVINMSYATCWIQRPSCGRTGYDAYNEEHLEYVELNECRNFDAAITQLKAKAHKDIVLVAAAGNDRAWDSPPSAPAMCDNVISVAASGPRNRIGYFSTGNKYVDVAAPGVDIWSTYPDDIYAVASGTSMAAPVVSGIVAHMFARCPKATAVDIEEALTSTAFNPNGFRRDNDFGYGIVQPLEAIQSLIQNSDCVVNPSRVPGIPRTLSVVPGDGSVTASWSPPRDNGGSPITHYTVYWDGNSITTSDMSYTVTGLINGTSYAVSVTANNKYGQSSPAATTVVLRPPESVPGMPQNVVVTPGDQSLEVSWSPPLDDGGSPIVGYSIEYYGTRSDGKHAGNGTYYLAYPRSLSRTVGYGLVNGVSYDVSVTAINQFGHGPPATTTAVPAGVPGAPLSLTGVVRDSRLDLSWWAPNSDDPLSISEYIVSWGTGSTTVNSTSSHVSYSITGLNNGTPYTVSVITTNQHGQSSAAAIRRTPVGVPGVPRGLSAVAGDGSLSVSWSPPANDGARRSPAIWCLGTAGRPRSMAPRTPSTASPTGPHTPFRWWPPTSMDKAAPALLGVLRLGLRVCRGVCLRFLVMGVCRCRGRRRPMTGARRSPATSLFGGKGQLSPNLSPQVPRTRLKA